MKEHGIRNNVLPKGAPNLNDRCERVLFAPQSECLQKFIVSGKRYLDHLLAEFADYYYTARSCMVRDHLPPVRKVPEKVDVPQLDTINIRSYVGRLVKLFERRVVSSLHDCSSVVATNAALDWPHTADREKGPSGPLLHASAVLAKLGVSVCSGMAKNLVALFSSAPVGRIKPLSPHGTIAPTWRPNRLAGLDL